MILIRKDCNLVIDKCYWDYNYKLLIIGNSFYNSIYEYLYYILNNVHV